MLLVQRMKANKGRKLSLKKETLKSLSATEMSQAAGGSIFVFFGLSPFLQGGGLVGPGPIGPSGPGGH